MAIKTYTRIKGKNGTGLCLKGVDYWTNLSEWGIEQSEKNEDGVTFADYLAGGNSGAWTLTVKGVQSTQTGSLWRFLWENAGETVDMIAAPHGNKTAAHDKPHFTGRVHIPRRPALSSKAGDEKGSDFDMKLEGQGPLVMTEDGSTLGTDNMEDSKG